jgi:hypothetical protein
MLRIEPEAGAAAMEEDAALRGQDGRSEGVEERIDEGHRESIFVDD